MHQQSDATDKSDVSTSKSISPTRTIADRFILGPILERNAFGEIRLGQDMQTSETIVVKTEQILEGRHVRLATEQACYQALNGCEGIPHVLYYEQRDQTAILVIEEMGVSLADLFSQCERRFSLKTVVLIGLQVIDRLETIHSKGFIHRDIQPANFVIRHKEKDHIISMVNFGLAKELFDSRTGQHISYRQNRPPIGTILFMSVNVHVGCEYSPRDDLESLGYMLIFFLHGHLPWQSISHNKSLKLNHRLKQVLRLKQLLTSTILCSGTQAPSEFLDYFNYVRQIDFYDTPDYDRLRVLFHSLLERNSFTVDWIYDWTVTSKTEHVQDAENNENTWKVQSETNTDHLRTNLRDQHVFYRTCNIMINELRHTTLPDLLDGHKQAPIVVITDLDSCCCTLSIKTKR